MNSPHQREQLPDLLSDALDATERARVESHLRECPQCARELRELQQIQIAVAALPAAPVPARVRANVRAALREKPRRQFVLPFALPMKSRQLAWGGAGLVAAVGLMLLARPSLQRDDAFSPSAPVSDTEMATSSAHTDGALPDKAVAAKTSQPSAPGGATSRKPAPQKSTPAKPAIGKRAPDVILNSKAPKVLSPLPAPPVAPQPAANEPSGALPSFAFPVAPAPLAPPKTNKPKSRAVAPADLKSELNAKSDARTDGNFAATITGTKPAEATAKNALPGQNAPKKSEEITPKSQTGNALSQNDSAARPPSAMSAAPLSSPPIALPAPMTAPPIADTNGTVSRDAGDAATKQSNNPQPNAMLRKREPSAQTERANRASDAPDLAVAGAVARAATAPVNSANWPGGVVKATLAPRADAQKSAGSANVQRFALPKKAPLILTFGVAKPIGRARLILLTPAGQVEIWRGELNEKSAQVEISQSILDKAKLKFGQKLRARLEQIDGDDNPISSSTFELLVP